MQMRNRERPATLRHQAVATMRRQWLLAGPEGFATVSFFLLAVLLMTAMHASQKIFRGMSRAQLDDAYNNGKAVADSAQWTAIWVERSTGIRRRSDAVLGTAYGPRE